MDNISISQSINEIVSSMENVILGNSPDRFNNYNNNSASKNLNPVTPGETYRKTQLSGINEYGSPILTIRNTNNYNIEQDLIIAAKDTSSCLTNNEDFPDSLSRFKFFTDCQRKNSYQSLKKSLEDDPSLANIRQVKGELYHGQTPLHTAAMHANVEAIKLLLQSHKVSAWSRDLYGRTPLHLASIHLHLVGSITKMPLEEVLTCCSLLREAMIKERGIDPVGCSAPVDLAGLSPMGWVNRESKGKASPALKQLLFRPGDVSVLPRTPTHSRAGQSPLMSSTKRSALTAAGVTSARQKYLLASHAKSIQKMGHHSNNNNSINTSSSSLQGATSNTLSGGGNSNINANKTTASTTTTRKGFTDSLLFSPSELVDRGIFSFFSASSSSTNNNSNPKISSSTKDNVNNSTSNSNAGIISPPLSPSPAPQLFENDNSLTVDAAISPEEKTAKSESDEHTTSSSDIASTTTQQNPSAITAELKHKKKPRRTIATTGTGIQYGYSTANGWRDSMEDKVATACPLKLVIPRQHSNGNNRQTTAAVATQSNNNSSSNTRISSNNSSATKSMEYLSSLFLSSSMSSSSTSTTSSSSSSSGSNNQHLSSTENQVGACVGRASDVVETEEVEVGLFTVCDGHGGSLTARYITENITSVFTAKFSELFQKEYNQIQERIRSKLSGSMESVSGSSSGSVGEGESSNNDDKVVSNAFNTAVIGDITQSINQTTNDSTNNNTNSSSSLTSLSAEEESSTTIITDKFWSHILTTVCATLESQLRQHPRMKLPEKADSYGKASAKDSSGSTAVITLVTATHMYFANVGDSRAVLGRNNISTIIPPTTSSSSSHPSSSSTLPPPSTVTVTETQSQQHHHLEAVALTKDHKFHITESPAECARAYACHAKLAPYESEGGYLEVSIPSASNENESNVLRMSRSFGDFLFKRATTTVTASTTTDTTVTSTAASTTAAEETKAKTASTTAATTATTTTSTSVPNNNNNSTTSYASSPSSSSKQGDFDNDDDEEAEEEDENNCSNNSNDDKNTDKPEEVVTTTASTTVVFVPESEQAVIAVPEITVHTRNNSDLFVVMASDGVWDVLGNEQVVQFVNDTMSSEWNTHYSNSSHHSNSNSGFVTNSNGTTAAAGAVMMECISQTCDKLLERSLEKGSVDNMSVIIIWLNNHTINCEYKLFNDNDCDNDSNDEGDDDCEDDEGGNNNNNNSIPSSDESEWFNELTATAKKLFDE